MPFDRAQLRALAEAKQAKDQEAAARELTEFESKRLEDFLEWLEVELERVAEFGYFEATLSFKEGFGEGLGDGLGWDASVVPSDNSAALGASDSIRVGSKGLPIEQAAGFVIDSVKKFGIQAELKLQPEPRVYLSW